MAIGLGNLGNIIEDFTSSLNQIFGGSGAKGSQKGGSEAQLFNASVGGTVKLDKSKWIGNAGNNKTKVRYGFATLKLQDLRSLSDPSTAVSTNPSEIKGPYYLDIPPQAIQQKEIFSNQISATRKGVIVESEGVVFRDIVIQGTTGIMPGRRGNSNVPQSNLFTDPTSPPSPPSGVDRNTGLSRDPNTVVLSGYEEFLRLRQFFLKYAADKVAKDGNLFLIFINEKDNQSLIVEPMEFTMTRDAKSPLTYNYRIVMKGIGDLNTVFSNEQDGTNNRGGILGFLEDVGNVSANVSAAIQQGRAAFNQSIRLLRRISQAVDTTINGPLRQVQFATEDVKDGVATTLALPEILVRNASDTVLNIRENYNDIEALLGLGAFSAASVPPKEKPGQTVTTADREDLQQDYKTTVDVLDRIENDEKVPIPRATLENTRNDLETLSNNLTDFVGLGDPSYDALKGRVSTIQADPLKVVSDDEFILMGEFLRVQESLNLALASNALFKPDAELAFENASEEFQNDNISEEQQIRIVKPNFVREVTIERNDTLERIAQREYGNALRWLDIVVLNSLKPPYISENGEDGTKKPGEKLLVGDI